MGGIPRYRVDDLREFGAALGAAAGIGPARASRLVRFLLWFDAAGAASFGIGALPEWLDRIAAKEVDPAAEGRVAFERTGTAVLDGRRGLPLLVLARAGELAVEKARDSGVGLVRVSDVDWTGPAAVVAEEIAAGPHAALLLGPTARWSVGLPSSEGPPAVFDSVIGASEPGHEVAGQAQGPAPPAGLLPWASALVPDGGWLVAALSVLALEPLATFHERVSASLGRPDAAGLAGRVSETCRREARERGLPVEPDAWARLLEWAARLGVAAPAPFGAC